MNWGHGPGPEKTAKLYYLARPFQLKRMIDSLGPEMIASNYSFIMTALGKKASIEKIEQYLKRKK